MFHFGPRVIIRAHNRQSQTNPVIDDIMLMTAFIRSTLIGDLYFHVLVFVKFLEFLISHLGSLDRNIPRKNNS